MPSHVIAIFGGAASGAEATLQATKRGIRCIVFDQNPLPYGKLDDGLPKWHAKLRDKEEQNINNKLNNPLVQFVPNTKLGRDINLDEIANKWGVSAVVLATGAWNDRPLPIEGIDQYVNKGLYYQNKFIHWFNHFHEPTYKGPQYEVADGAIVIGGGLASLDMCKALMMETVQAALAKKGIKVNMFDLERGIDRVLQEKGLTLADLGLKGCTLYYRRRIMDMPLSPTPATTPEQIEKNQKTTEKILNNAATKFLFKAVECMAPVDKIVENGRLAGIIFRKTKLENGKAVEIPGSETAVKASLVISSIGSIPEPIPGIPMRGQVFVLSNPALCKIDGFDNVFAVGNAVTGRGNINESLKHGREMSTKIMDDYLGWKEEKFQEMVRAKESGAAQAIEALATTLNGKPLLTDDQVKSIDEKVKALQQKSGYDGNYQGWVEKNLPERLEHLLGIEH
jgi:NADPH-dependent glutamate synthase beta subunit-like oxidoreductase